MKSSASLTTPALLLAAAAISFAAIFFRKAAPTHPLCSAGIRLLIAAVLLSPLTVRAALKGRLPPRVLGGATLAGLFYGLHFGTWVTSLTFTSVAASVTLVTATPLLLAGVSFVTGRDRPDRRLWSALGLALCGVLILGAHDSALKGDALLGDALALAGAGAMVGYLLLGRRLGPGLDVWAFSGVATAVGAATLLGAALVAGVPVTVSRDAFTWLLLSALVPQLIGHTLLTWALRHVRPTVVGIATVGEPVGATLLAWAWLGDRPSALVLVGCAVTLSAVIIAVARPTADH